jgi:hypothetical protein
LIVIRVAKGDASSQRGVAPVAAIVAWCATIAVFVASI